MSDHDLQKYTETMIAQQEKFKENLFDLSIYSNGSISLDNLYSMPLKDISILQDRLSKKLKQESNIKQNQYL